MMAAPSGRDDVASLNHEDQGVRLLAELCPDAVIVTTGASVVFANAAALRRFGGEDTAHLVGHPLPPLSADEALSHDIVFRGAPSRLLLFRGSNGPDIETIAARLRHDLAQPLNVIRLAAEGALLMIERGKTPEQGWPETQFALIAEQAERTSLCLDELNRLFRPKSAFNRPHPVGVSPAPATAGTHLVLVGNNPALLDHLRRRSHGRVSVAATCTDAWTLLHRDPADVVVIDPDETTGDDDALIARLRDLDPLQPIILTEESQVTQGTPRTTNLDERFSVIGKPIDWLGLDDVIDVFLRPPPDDDDASP